MFYDCCLINWYPDGESACKWHADPEHGSIWSLQECVVSFGEVRRFNLKRVVAAAPGAQVASRVKFSGEES